MANDPEVQRRVEEVFVRVAEAAPAERDAVLARECGDDAALREEVESLLASDSGGLTLIQDLVAKEAASLVAGWNEGWLGHRVGIWRITNILGRGGMGAVYEVERDDGAFQQRAALKIVRAEINTESGRARFLEERQILAQLNHPNIARILDGGRTEDGAPYLVMEAVDGVSITEHCARNHSSIEARLRLFATVCRAVHFAHTQLIVHRDLKPSNILVTADGTAKLLDFGIAKLIAPGSRETHVTTELAWTPDYAAPEQMRGEPVTTVSDIYSLGAVLFELLTGRKAQELSTSQALRGDLDAIVRMALHEVPSRRYASAEQLAQDVERHLDGLPVLARHDSWRYRAGKFVRRNRIAVVAAALIVVSLIGGIAGTMWQARRAERRFRQVRNLANTFLFTFHDEIRDLAGATRARELVAGTALEYLDNLARDAEDDRELQMELGAAYEKVGDVLGNPRQANLGRSDEALASYEKSLQLRLAASGVAIDEESEGRAVLHSHIKIADILLNNGNTDGSQPHVEKAHELAQRFGTPLDRAAALGRRGELALRRGDLATTEQMYRDALGEAKKAAELEPGTATATSVVSTASRLGYVYKMASRQQEALAVLGVALESAKRLHAEEPKRSTHVRTIMNIHNDRGDTLRSQFAAEGMRPDLSLKEYEEALRRATWLSEADPSEFSARFGVLMAKTQIADTWREIEPARAVPLFEELLPRADAMHAEDPSNFQVEWISALLWLAYADATRGAGNSRDALSRYDVAVARIEKMRQTDRGRSISRRDVVKAHTDRGSLQLTTGNVDAAANDAEACRSYAAKFVTADARPTDLRDVALCYELAGDVAMRRRDRASAVHDYDEAIVRWRELARRKLDSPYLREHRASVEQRRAAALRER